VIERRYWRDATLEQTVDKALVKSSPRALALPCLWAEPWEGNENR
jgi:hypothetical protein